MAIFLNRTAKKKRKKEMKNQNLKMVVWCLLVSLIVVCVASVVMASPVAVVPVFAALMASGSALV